MARHRPPRSRGRGLVAGPPARHGRGESGPDAAAAALATSVTSTWCHRSERHASRRSLTLVAEVLLELPTCGRRHCHHGGCPPLFRAAGVPGSSWSECPPFGRPPQNLGDGVAEMSTCSLGRNSGQQVSHVGGGQEDARSTRPQPWSVRTAAVLADTRTDDVLEVGVDRAVTRFGAEPGTQDLQPNSTTFRRSVSLNPIQHLALQNASSRIVSTSPVG